MAQKLSFEELEVIMRVGLVGDSLTDIVSAIDSGTLKLDIRNSLAHCKDDNYIAAQIRDAAAVEAIKGYVEKGDEYALFELAKRYGINGKICHDAVREAIKIGVAKRNYDFLIELTEFDRPYTGIGGDHRAFRRDDDIIDSLSTALTEAIKDYVANKNYTALLKLAHNFDTYKCIRERADEEITKICIDLTRRLLN